MTFGTGFPIGTILMGVIADLVGVRAVLVGAGALVALVLLGVTVRGLLPHIDKSSPITARAAP
jgi:predicted MFS family arabinose efflux permease